MSLERRAPLILIVEDEADIRSALKDFLESEGYSTQAAANGREALAWLERGLKPALILLDMRMPLMNGWEFAEAYFSLHDRQAPILVMTAAADAEARAREVHADGWVGKPFGLDELLDKIRKTLERAAARSA